MTLTSATIHAPPATLERRYVFALALRTLAVGASLTAVAAKDKGGNRMADELRAMGCAVADISRSHHRICTVQRPAELHGVDDIIAAGGMQLHPAHGLWTQAGIFSWDRIDAGSALLLKHLPAFAGRGADLGCGLGVLGRAVLRAASVVHLTMVDIDRRAVTAAKKNVPDTRAQHLWADVCGGAVALDGLDFVVMNPPFHDTGIENKSLGQQFIAQAAAMLKKDGQCWLTANRHLPYEAVLAQQFAQVRLVDEADGFKIYHAEK